MSSISDCDFIENTAPSGSGGGVAFIQATGAVTRCNFHGNSADRVAGALDLFEPTASSLVDNCTFSYNTATLYGGAIYNWCAWFTHDQTFRNCTFVGNGSAYGSSLCHTGDTATTVIENCIIAFEQAGVPIFCRNNYLPTLVCCNMFGNHGSDWSGRIAEQAAENGNMSEPPEFCSLAEEDYALQESSPCAPENNDCGVLVGAHDVGCTACCTGMRGNVDNDDADQVNIEDVTLLVTCLFGGNHMLTLECWHEANVNGDPNHDINIIDLTYLVMYLFGDGLEPPSCPRG